jgi:hypothetical protein
MSRQRLSDTDQWMLANPQHDVRGWTVRGPNRTDLGSVEDFIIDTETGNVISIVLDTGREFVARGLRIGKGVVYAGHTGATTDTRQGSKDIGTPLRIVPVTEEGERYAPDNFDDLFRRHFAEAVEEGHFDEAEYSDVRPAYVFGRQQASDARFRGRTFGQIEEHLRARFGEAHPSIDYAAVREAVEFGFTQARALTGSGGRVAFVRPVDIDPDLPQDADEAPG